MSTSIPELTIVLPAYKECKNLEVLIPRIETAFSDVHLEIVVVDDNSRDGTSELIGKLNQQYGNVTVLERPGLLGIGSALRDGYNKARGQYILSSDSDLSFNEHDMKRLFVKMKEGFDLVLGYKISEELEGERRKRGLHAWMEEYVTSPLSNGIIRLFCGVRLRNYNTDFRIMRAELWNSIRTVEDRQFFLLETIIRFQQHGARITEIPVTFSPRKFGESKVSFFKQAPAYFAKLVKATLLEKN